MMKLVIHDNSVKAYINNDEIPSLVVKTLNDRKMGKVELFTADRSGGDFKKMKIYYEQ